VATGNGRDRDQEHGVGPWDGSRALCQVVDLGGIGMLPQSAIRAFSEFSIFSKLTGVRLKAIPWRAEYTVPASGGIHMVACRPWRWGEWQGCHLAWVFGGQVVVGGGCTAG